MSHEVRLSMETLQWKTTAEIRTENAPAFVHVLHVDPRLKIDSISIQEDGVERLVRYSRSGEYVTLFSRDRPAATQDLVLTGSMPLDPGREIALPAVSLVGATDSDVRLRLEPDPQVDVTVTSSPSSTEMAEPREGKSGKASVSRVRDYQLEQNSQLPTIRVTLRAENPHIACATVIRLQKQETLDVTLRLHFSGTRGPDGPVEITLTRDLAARCAISADVKNHVRRHLDGTSGIVLDAADPTGPADVALQWTETPRGKNWELPKLTVTNAMLDEAFLLLAEPIAWRPSPDSAASRQESASPEWMNPWLGAAQTFRGWKSAEPGLPKWVLTRQVTSPEREPHIQIYTRLFLHSEGLVLGSTFFHLEQLEEPALTVKWPKSAILRAAFLDGVPVQPIPERDGQIAIPLRARGKEHRVALHWTDSNRSSLSAVGKVSEEVPLPGNVTAKTMLFAVTPVRLPRRCALAYPICIPLSESDILWDGGGVSQGTGGYIVPLLESAG